MAKKQGFGFYNTPPFLEKKIWVSEEEYYNLLITKGKYEELKEITDKLLVLLISDEGVSLVSCNKK